MRYVRGVVVNNIPLRLQLQMFMQLEIRAERIDFLTFLERILRKGIPLAIDLQPRGEGCTNGKIKRLCIASAQLLIGKTACTVRIQHLELSDGTASFMSILRTYRPVLAVELHTCGPTTLDGFYTLVLCRTTPSKNSDEESLNRLQLKRSDQILTSIGILGIDALTIKNATLIMDESMLRTAPTDIQKITLKLNTQITTTIAAIELRIGVIAETRQFLCKLAEIAHANIPRVHGILETEWTLELTKLDTGLGNLLILNKRIFQVNRFLHLHLDTVGEMTQHLTIDISANQTRVKARAAVGPTGTTVFITAHVIASELRCGCPIRQLTSKFHWFTLRLCGLHGAFNSSVNQPRQKARRFIGIVINNRTFHPVISLRAK